MIQFFVLLAGAVFMFCHFELIHPSIYMVCPSNKSLGVLRYPLQQLIVIEDQGINQ